MRIPAVTTFWNLPCYVKLYQSIGYSSLEASPGCLFTQLELLRFLAHPSPHLQGGLCSELCPPSSQCTATSQAPPCSIVQQGLKLSYQIRSSNSESSLNCWFANDLNQTPDSEGCAEYVLFPLLILLVEGGTLQAVICKCFLPVFSSGRLHSCSCCLAPSCLQENGDVLESHSAVPTCIKVIHTTCVCTGYRQPKVLICVLVGWRASWK